MGAGGSILGDGDRKVNSPEVGRARTCKLLEIRNVTFRFCNLSDSPSGSINSY